MGSELLRHPWHESSARETPQDSPWVNLLHRVTRLEWQPTREGGARAMRRSGCGTEHKKARVSSWKRRLPQARISRTANRQKALPAFLPIASTSTAQPPKQCTNPRCFGPPATCPYRQMRGRSQTSPNCSPCPVAWEDSGTHRRAPSTPHSPL